MAKLNLPPTKSTMLSVRRDLAFATEGYDLLEQKRQILVLELMTRVGKARAVQKEVDDVLGQAHAVLRSALADAGVLACERESLGISGTHETGVSEQRVMGINLPQVAVKVLPAAPEFAPGSGPAQSDDCVREFRRALEEIGRLAEIENAVVRLARELRKTQRRVNALEKIFLPDYRETLKYVGDVLEERERDGFVIMKMTKDRMEAREESNAGGT